MLAFGIGKRSCIGEVFARSHVPFYSYPDAVGNSDWARWKVLARPGADRNASKNISTATAVWSLL